MVYGQSENSGLKISYLTDDFYIYTTYKEFNGYKFPSNSMYLITEIGAVLFDTPWDTTQFQPLLDSIKTKHNKEVVLCISTHYHDDRTAGLEFFKQKGIKTYTSKLTYELCKEFEQKQPEFYFENDTTFEIGNHKFETYYPGEGHTKDNIVVWFEDEKILYGGCFIKSTENKDLGNIADANPVEWEFSIKNAIKKYPKPEFVIPGHFDWTKGKELKHTLKLLKQNKKEK
jgi:glyoxylase-like metal-dependent hydrolase (beta-lactamase superfamily II)